MSQKIASTHRNTMTRRRFVQAASISVALVATGLTGRRAYAENLPQLSEDDAMAKALSYVHDASTVDESTRPADRYCNNCSLYAGGADDEWAGCGIFPGKAVAGRGWCSAWAPKANG
jgi:hypothetical protein